MLYEEIISLENLFTCWGEFKRGKGSRLDVCDFDRYLEDNIFALHCDLANHDYRHGAYHTFHIHDPKHRVISKATVRDRLVHHMVFNELYRIFDPTFIYHSYASRLDKGTHLAVHNLSCALRAVSRNYTRTIWALKCDIKKFFYNVSHHKLLQIIKKKIKDDQFLQLVCEIVKSFPPVDKKVERKILGNNIPIVGLPIGNVTSQVFANIYLNELDQFIKHELHLHHYFRYADDFIIVHDDPHYLHYLVGVLGEFLSLSLSLELHPRKVEVRKFSQGIDFLGYVILPHYIVLRTSTKQRMFRKLSSQEELAVSGNLEIEKFKQIMQSYLGLLTHCDGYELGQVVKNRFGFKN